MHTYKVLCYGLTTVVLIVLLVPGGTRLVTAAPSQPAAFRPLERMPAEMLAAQGSGIWRSYTNGNSVDALAVEGDRVWAGTRGGVVRWNRTDGTYVKYTTADGLADNGVWAVAIDGAGHK